MQNAWIATKGLNSKVMGFCTTRHHGVSAKPFDSLNLGDHVGDDPLCVQANRQRLSQWLPDSPVWVQQVHGDSVVVVDEGRPSEMAQADALVTTTPGRVLGILTADCMAVVLANDAGTVLGVAHAGWRGLAGGILQSTVQTMRGEVDSIGPWRAWIGPCIGPQAFEVGDEVREAFVALSPALEAGFKKNIAPHKWLCDMPGIARHLLFGLGADSVTWCGLCTVNDSEQRFFSYRREGRTGRMATVAWIA